MLRSLHKVPECIVALLFDLRCADVHGVMAIFDDEIIQIQKALEIE